MASFQAFIVVVLVVLLQTLLTNATIITGDKVLRTGRLRYFYNDNDDAVVEDDDAVVCKNILILGVGTGMTTLNYNKLSSEIASKVPVIVFIVDHNPFWLPKTSEQQYANLVLDIVSNLDKLLPTVCRRPAVLEETKVLIGGHSGSGQAARRSIPILSKKGGITPHGFVGLDPFQLDPNNTIDIPTFNYGFTKTSCKVTNIRAAWAGYRATRAETGRVLVRTNNAVDGLGHCDFTDSGCYGLVCPRSKNANIVRKSAGACIAKFIQSLDTGSSFDRSSFASFLPLPFSTVYVNKDKVKDKDNNIIVQKQYRLRGKKNIH